MRRLLIPTLAAGLVLLGLVVGPYAGDPNAGLLEIGPRSGRSFDLFGSDDEPAAKAEPAGVPLASLRCTPWLACTTARLGRMDVLVNNAGLGGNTPVIEMTDEEWDRVLNVTLTSVMRATRAALGYFRDAGHGGAIVNNASVLGWRAQHSQSHYAAAKAGVMALTRCSAIEAVDYGVRINAVSPSIARHRFLEKTSSAELLDRLSGQEAFGRAAEPWEVAATVAFLASDYASYLTGEVISVSSQHP